MLRSSFVVCACLMLCPSTARAAAITFSFEGIVDSVGFFDPALFAADPTGTTFSGHYTFDSAAADAIPADTESGSYTGSNLSLLIGGQTFNFNPVSIGVTNFGLPAADQYLVGFFDVLTDLSIRLEDFQSTVFASDALPLTPPPLASFESRFFFFQVSDASFNPLLLDANGTLTALTCTAGCDPPTTVPEPATISLLAGGLGALIARRRRARKR